VKAAAILRKRGAAKAGGPRRGVKAGDKVNEVEVADGTLLGRVADLERKLEEQVRGEKRRLEEAFNEWSGEIRKNSGGGQQKERGERKEAHMGIGGRKKEEQEAGKEASGHPSEGSSSGGGQAPSAFPLRFAGPATTTTTLCRPAVKKLGCTMGGGQHHHKDRPLPCHMCCPEAQRTRGRGSVGETHDINCHPTCPEEADAPST
jgi:hypothetical protein